MISNLELKINDSCSFCLKPGHIKKSCSTFMELKITGTKTSYVESKLRENDLHGFSSAGFLVYIKYDNKYYALLAKENRHNLCKYNFIGGKRDYLTETPFNTALREFMQELTLDNQCMLHPQTVCYYNQMFNVPRGQVLWNAPAKYALFGLELPSTEWTLAAKLVRA